jgi:hypothetical protein
VQYLILPDQDLRGAIDLRHSSPSVLLSTHLSRDPARNQIKKRKKKRDLKNQTTKRSSSFLPKYAILRLPSSRGWEGARLATAKIAGCIDLGNNEPRSAMAMPNLV